MQATLRRLSQSVDLPQLLRMATGAGMPPPPPELLELMQQSGLGGGGGGIAGGLEAQARDKSSALFRGKHTSKTDGLGLKLVRAAWPGFI